MKIIETFYKKDSDNKNRQYCRLECQHCNSLYERPKRRLGNGFCSQLCKSIFEKHTSIVTCAVCAKEFSKSKSKQNMSKSGLFFCCRMCKDIGQSTIKEIQPDHYGSGNSNYRERAFRYYDPICNRCGFKNILALEVHHKDRDRSNNHVDNLEILCANCHKIEHFKT